MRFKSDEKGGVKAIFQAKPLWQGYQGILHGGMISTLLDAAMTHCLFDHGVEAMTVDLNIRFHKPVSCTGLLMLRACLLGERRNLYQLSAELSSAGTLLARAEARFMRFKPDHPLTERLIDDLEHVA